MERTVEHIMFDLEKQITKGQEWILDNTIFLTKAGSQLYGISHKQSDLDYVGITVCKDPRYWIRTSYNFEQFQTSYVNEEGKKVEVTIYNILKFLKLASEGNPNVAEILFVKENDPNVQLFRGEWLEVLSHKDKMISKKSEYTFGGMANSQRQKLVIKQNNKTGRRYITDEFTFDTKFMAHSIRILQQGIELLETGNIVFPRPNAQELLDIRFGKKYKNVTDYFADWDILYSKLGEAAKNSKLPNSPNREWLSQYICDIYERWVKKS